MIICLGPICIPLWGLLPFVTMFIGVVWQRIKQWSVSRAESLSVSFSLSLSRFVCFVLSLSLVLSLSHSYVAPWLTPRLTTPAPFTLRLGYATAAAKSSPAAAVEPSAPPAVDSKAPAALAANLVQRKPKVTYENSGHVPAPQGVVVVRDSDHWRTLLDSASNEGLSKYHLFMIEVSSLNNRRALGLLKSCVDSSRLVLLILIIYSSFDFPPLHLFFSNARRLLCISLFYCSVVRALQGHAAHRRSRRQEPAGASTQGRCGQLPRCGGGDACERHAHV